MKEELETMSLRCMITRGDFGAPEPSHIEGRVYLGNEVSAVSPLCVTHVVDTGPPPPQQNAFNQSQLDAVGITHVLNMAGQCKNYWATNYTYKHIMMLDQVRPTDTQSVARRADLVATRAGGLGPASGGLCGLHR